MCFFWLVSDFLRRLFKLTFPNSKGESSLFQKLIPFYFYKSFSSLICCPDSWLLSETHINICSHSAKLPFIIPVIRKIVSRRSVLKRLWNHQKKVASQPTKRPDTARKGRGNGAKEKVKKGLIFTFLCHIVIVIGLPTPLTLVMCPMGRHF